MKDDRMKLVKTVAILVVILALLFLCLEIETLAAPGEDVSTQAPNGGIKKAASGKPVGAATDVGCTGVFVAAPSIVQVGEEFSVGLKILTKPYVVGASCYNPPLSVKDKYNVSPRGITYMENVPATWTGTVQIDGGDGYQGPTRISFAPKADAALDANRPVRRVGPMRLTKPGLYTLRVSVPSAGITQTSNPIRAVAEKPKRRLFWGEIHCHTFLSDGVRCPEQVYAFARDDAFLDVCSVTDHSEYMTERQWDYEVNVANDFNQPGRFVTLVGQEWTSMKFGHRNIYFPGASGPHWSSNDPVWGKLDNLYRAAREHHALVVPHHTASAAMGVTWSAGTDPEVERLVEIYSAWGNSERPVTSGNPRPIRFSGGEKPGAHVVDALQMGRKYGFVGGGDTHDGRPGDGLHWLQDIPEYRMLHRQGIVGVWADDLSRASIFEALWNRRVFATTNVRIILEFSVARCPMGSEVVLKERAVPVRVDCASEVPVARVDLVRNGEDCQTANPHLREVGLEWVDKPKTLPAWYYVRIVREDSEMAWSSPVWVRLGTE